MTYQEVLENARKRMAPRCRVCPECNGIACKGVMPGPAGKGASRTFQRNVAWLGDSYSEALGGRCGEETAERGRGGASVCLCHGY